MTNELQDILQRAKNAKTQLATMQDETRSAILIGMAAAVLQHKDKILKANQEDVKNAQGRISSVMIDRLRLTAKRIEEMADGILSVEELPCPLGLLEREYNHPNGLYICKVRVPIGVVAIIYESRPNVTSDAAALCIKSGNACILRGGSDAINTNTVICSVLAHAAEKAGAPLGAVQLVRDTGHDSAALLMQARGFVDLLIPRGGAGLIRAVVEGAKGVPVIETGTGICHMYVDKEADLNMALNLVENAKTSRPSVCNAAEVCLVHKDIAKQFLPMLKNQLKDRVELRLSEAAGEIISGQAATQQDFCTEFLDYILAVDVVQNLNDAVLHINAHSTGHSDAIVTKDGDAAEYFLKTVDSAAVYVNASTRFTDGAEFGLGCEMGISTQKIGARGPMGLYELTSYKYTIHGAGQMR